MKKTAVITGGAGGLGRALATQLQADGWFTAIIDLAGPALDQVSANDQQAAYACDLTKPADVKRICARITKDRPSIDLVVYNAGITQIGLFQDTPLETHRAVMDVNYFGAVFIAAEFLQEVRKSQGTHLAISSVAGFTPLYKRTAYAASKHALEGFFKSLRGEESDHGVTTLIAAPSFVATNIGNSESQKDGIARPGSATDGVDYMTAVDAASVILSGLKRKKSAIYVGRVAKLASLINRVSPSIFARIMERKIKNNS